MASDDLCEADGARQRFGALLMRRVAVAVHEINRSNAEAIVIGCPQSRARSGFVERSQHFAMGGDALVDLDDTIIEWRR